MLKRRRQSSSLSPSVEPECEQLNRDNGDDGNDAKKISRSSTGPLLVQEVHDIKRSFLVAKWIMIRLLGMVYFVAFLGAYNQNVALIGSDGLVPAKSYMSEIRSRYPNSNLHGFFAQPTLFWWIPLTDAWLDAFSIFGIVLSSLVVLGLDSWLLLFLLWLIDFSVVTVASSSSFYSYGWESQLLETGFIAIFLCDLPSIAKIRDRKSDTWRWRLTAVWKDDVLVPTSIGHSVSAPSTAALWLMRWLCFRISTGAGLIKVRGGSCWADKTCLHYHFETQPIPSPMSFLFHFLPKSILSRAVDLDLFVQLYSIVMVMVPGIVGRVGGIIQAGFMVNIMMSGNFAFLNHLTVIPALACLDDAFWLFVLPRWMTRHIHNTNQTARPLPEENTAVKRMATLFRLLIDMSFVFLIGYLSIPVVENLLQWGGSRQQMNASFNSLRLVNTYGAFGSVGHARYEPIISVSRNGKEWVELEFPCKPGNVERRPCFCAPYHYRLDWNIWFIGFKPHEQMLRSRETWLFGLLSKILSGRRGRWLSLLDKSAESELFGDGREHEMGPIKYAKVDMYHYRMASPLWEIIIKLISRQEFAWWQRSYEEPLIPSVVLDKERGSLRNAPDLGE